MIFFIFFETIHDTIREFLEKMWGIKSRAARVRCCVGNVASRHALSSGWVMDGDGDPGTSRRPLALYPLARDVFQSERARALLAKAENDEAAGSLGFRVRVRVMRSGPNWRLEAGVFLRRLPLFPRLKAAGKGEDGVKQMLVAHGNKTAFQQVFERILRPIHLATLSEGEFQRALRERERQQTTLRGFGRWDSQSHWISTQMASAEALSSAGRKSVFEAAGIVDGVREPWRQPKPGETVVTIEAEHAHVMAKLLVSFILEEILTAEPDFTLIPFIRMHYTPNLGHVSWLALREDPDVNETPDPRVGSNFSEYLEFCQGRWGSHHSVQHVPHHDADGNELNATTEVGLLSYTKAQGPPDRPRDTFPVVGYLQWDVLSYDAVINFFTGTVGGRRLREFFRCVDGLGNTPKKAMAIVREIATTQKDASAIALFLYGHTWNPGKHFSRLINAHHLYTQPRLRSGGTEFCMNTDISCELAKIGTGRRSKAQVLFEHILLSDTFEHFRDIHPQYVSSLFFGSRSLLAAPFEGGDRVREQHWTTSVTAPPASPSETASESHEESAEPAERSKRPLDAAEAGNARSIRRRPGEDPAP